MSDSDGSPQQDDRHQRRSRSRSPVSPDWAGQTPADREKRRLAEPAVPVGPPAGQPRAACADTGPSTQGPGPAEETAPAAEATSPAAPPREGAPGGGGGLRPQPQKPRRGPDRGPRHAAGTGDSPGAGPGRDAGGCRGRRGGRGGCTGG